MHVRLGDLLASQGVLTAAQIDEVLDVQQRTHEPFGVICEKLFDIQPDVIEDAWTSQYVSITRKVDPKSEAFDDQVRDVVSRRQAWQFRVAPIRYDGAELMMVTTSQHLRRALRFVTRFIGIPVYLVIADPLALGQSLCERYPLGGMTPGSVNDEALDHLLAMARAPAG